jgi:Tfp pilus assembly protein PilX
MRRPQDGATLLVVLVMLVMITLLGITGVKMSSGSLQIVGNMQARKFVENQGQQAIEQVMSSIAPFNNPTAAKTVSSLPAGVGVVISNRTCQFSAPAAGYSAVSTLAPEDNIWEFNISVTDSFTGATARLTQGTKIRQLAGYCL